MSHHESTAALSSGSYSSSGRPSRVGGPLAPDAEALNTAFNQEALPWFSVVLPPKALPFILLFLFLFPLVVMGLESFLSPLYSLLLGVLMPFSQRMGSPEFPLILLIKFAVFAVIAFGTIGLLLLRILTIYHQAWASLLPQAHPMHTPFHPDAKLSMIAVVNWHVYRGLRLMAWPLGLLAVFTLGFILMTIIMQFLSEGFLLLAQLFLMLIIFALLLSGYFMMIQVSKTAVDYLKTGFGTTAAMLEPEQAAEIIFERVRRLMFYSPWFVLVYAQQVFCLVVVLLSILGMFGATNMDNLLGFGASWPMVILFSAISLAMIILKYGIQFFVYVDALRRFYHHKV